MESIDKLHGTYEKKMASISAKPQVSSAVIKRLPRYHRYLGELLREGKMRISSAELSELMGVILIHTVPTLSIEHLLTSAKFKLLISFS